MLCCHNYAERVVSIFFHQIQLEYNGVNISVSVEVIALEHFSVLPKEDINSTTLSRQRHTLIQSFYLMIANRILPLLMNTEIVLLKCLKTKNYLQHH